MCVAHDCLLRELSFCSTCAVVKKGYSLDVCAHVDGLGDLNPGCRGS